MKYLITLFLFIVLSIVQINCVGMPGGINPIKPEDVKEYHPLIERTYNEKTNDENYGKLIKVTKAQSQVVAGIKYIIDFTLGRTNCKRQDVLNGLKDATKECEEIDTHSCTAHIYVRLWEKYTGLESMKCHTVKFGVFAE